MSKPRQASSQASRRVPLRCIPTHVALASDDPEYAAAWMRLPEGLREAGLSDERDPRQPYRGDEWRYLCSIPRRHAGEVSYVHVFGHGCHPATGGALTCAIAAREGWWPSDQASMRLDRTWPRGRLSIVSSRSGQHGLTIGPGLSLDFADF